MTKYRDLENMIEVMNIAIARQEVEEEFFLRSARDPTSEIANQLFSEIAADLHQYRESLEFRRQKLVDALNDLRVAEKQAKATKMNKDRAGIRDPVCSMKIDKDKCIFTSTYKGKEYHFCTEDCKKAFDIAPEKHLKT